MLINVNNDIFSLPNRAYRVLELYHESNSGLQTYFTERSKEWDKLQDGYNFTTTDPYYFPYGDKNYKLRYALSPVNKFYIIALLYPQTYDSAFDYGNSYTEFEGYEDLIINGASGKLLIKADQLEKATGFLTLYQNSLKLLS